MYGDYVDPGEGPGNPYPYIAAAKAQELAAAQRELAELKEKAQYSYASEEALVCSDFFQNALKKSLAFKDREILALQNELLQFARATPSPPVAAPFGDLIAVPRATLISWRQWAAQSMSHAIEHEIAEMCAQPQPQPAQPLTDEALQKLSACGPVHCENGVVTRGPTEYRRELEARFERGWRTAEKHFGITAPSTPTQPEVAP